MSSNYSANQYEGAFRSRRLQNWCEVKSLKERPNALRGHTSYIANDRGHLLPGVAKGSPWPDFKGTWDLPARIPAHSINPTSRSVEGLNRLKSWGLHPQHSARSHMHSDIRNTDMQDAGEQTSEDVQQEGAAPSVGSVDQPAEDQQAMEAPGRDRPPSQCSAAEKPASVGTSSRPDAGRGRPTSDVAEK